MHSKNFQNIKNWYGMGLWGLERVKNAVVKGWITATEYKEITGKDYK